MAGHSHAANIAHRKNAQDSKRAKIFTKLQREITASVRAGGEKEDSNPRLRLAIQKAKGMNMSKDKIENAIKSAVGSRDGIDFSAIRYDGYASGGVGIIIEALTDNKNRTAGEVRAIFTKYGGNLGETGSLDFSFSHVGVIVYPLSVNYEKLFEASVIAGAESVEQTEHGSIVCTNFDSFHAIKGELESAFGEPELAEVQYRALNSPELSQESIEKIRKLIDALEDSDDVQNVWTIDGVM